MELYCRTTFLALLPPRPPIQTLNVKILGLLLDHWTTAVGSRAITLSGSASYQSLLRDRLVTQICLLFWLGGMTALFACPPVDVILAQLACPLNDVIFMFTSGITNLSLYKHCLILETVLSQVVFTLPSIASLHQVSAI
jgi:hypothetical protein